MGPTVLRLLYVVPAPPPKPSQLPIGLVYNFVAMIMSGVILSQGNSAKSRYKQYYITRGQLT